MMKKREQVVRTPSRGHDEQIRRLEKQCLFLCDELGRELMRESRAIQVNNLSLLQTSRFLQEDIQQRLEKKLAELRRRREKRRGSSAQDSVNFDSALAQKKLELQKLVRRNLDKASKIHERTAAEISELNNLSRKSGKNFPNFLQKSPPVMIDLRR